MKALLAVAVAALATYALRFAAVTVFSHRPVPAALERSLRYVAPALLAALVASALASALPGMDATEAAARLVALLAGLVVTVRTREPAAAMVVGLPVLWATSALLAGATAL